MDSLNKFGKYVIENWRDRTISNQLFLFSEEERVDANEHEFELLINSLNDKQRECLIKLIANTVDITIFNVLCSLQESDDSDKGIEIRVDNINLAKLPEDMSSGMLHGEMFEWIEQFSKYLNLKTLDF